MKKKEKENQYKQEWFENRTSIYNKTFEPILKKKRNSEYQAKLADYSDFLKGDLESTHYSILQLLRFKLTRNYNYLVKNQKRPDFDLKNLKSMKEAIKLLKQVEESDFGQAAAVKDFTKKWKPIRKKHKDQLPTSLLKKSNSEYQKITSDCHKKRKATLANAFTLITENLWNWWDEEYAGDETAITGKLEFPPEKN